MQTWCVYTLDNIMNPYLYLFIYHLNNKPHLPTNKRLLSLPIKVCMLHGLIYRIGQAEGIKFMSNHILWLLLILTAIKLYMWLSIILITLCYVNGDNSQKHIYAWRILLLDISRLLLYNYTNLIYEKIHAAIIFNWRLAMARDTTFRC